MVSGGHVLIAFLLAVVKNQVLTNTAQDSGLCIYFANRLSVVCALGLVRRVGRGAAY